MNRIAATVMAGGLLLAGAGAAQAQSAYGPGGMLVHPNALLHARGDWTAGASWFRQKNAGASSEWTVLTVVGGVTDRWEGGAMLLPAREGRENALSGGAFAKYRLQDFDGARPAVAIAASHTGGPIGLSSVAAVGSWNVAGAKKGSLLHAGLQWAQRSAGGQSRDAIAPFVGVQAPLTDTLAVLAEYGARFAFDRAARTGIGVTWNGDGRQRVAVGLVNVGRSASSQFFIGVGYPLGGGKH